MAELVTLCFNERSGMGVLTHRQNSVLTLFDYNALALGGKGLRSATAGQAFQSNADSKPLSTQPQQSLKPIVEKVDGTTEPQRIHSYTSNGTLDGAKLSAATQQAKLNGALALRVISESTINSHDLHAQQFHCHLIFEQLQFETGEFSALQSDYAIIFSGCTFNADVISFKNSRAEAGLVCIGCDFSAAEGLSFRGLQSQSLLLVGQCKGPRGLIWANDLALSGDLKLEGEFHGSLQINGNQAGDEKRRGHIGGNIIIGNHRESSPSDQPSAFTGRITIDNNNVGAGILFSNASVHHLRIFNNQINAVDGIAIEVDGCDIHSNLKIEDNSRLHGLIRLNNCDIDRALVLRRNGLNAASALDLHDCTAGDALFEPVSQLYGVGRTAIGRFFKPRFKLLSREQASNQNRDRRRLMEEYMRLKAWLANSGELLAEDIAFYNQQRLGGDSKIERALRWVVGSLFGWGVRLSHIFATSFAVLTIFGLIYWQQGFAPNDAAALSAQSFLNALLGDWDIGDKAGLLSWVIVSEATLGVLLITALVGAYLRKLLR